MVEVSPQEVRAALEVDRGRMPIGRHGHAATIEDPKIERLAISG